MAIESVVVVGLVVLAAGVLLWLRQTGRGLISEEDQVAQHAVVAELPSPVPTFTSPPRPTATRVLNTVAPPVTPMPATIVHEVQSGDTLFGIAQQYGVVPDEIIALNALDRPDALWIGQELTVPLRRDEPAEDAVAMADDAETAGEEPDAGASADGGDGSESGDSGSDGVENTSAATDAEREGEDGGEPVEPEESGGTLVMGEPEVHTVQRGESIGVIAANYDMTIDEVLALNEDRLEGANDTLMIGDEIVVGAGAMVTTTPAPTAAAPERAAGQEVGVGAAGGTAGEMSAVPFESAGESGYPAPAALGPAGGITVTAESPLLRWSSSGVLPRGLYYVVEVRPAGDDEHDPIVLWVADATAVRMPGALRPTLGSSSEVDWSVSVRRRAGTGLLGRGDESVLLSPEPQWQRFVWSPSAASADEAAALP